MTLHRQMEYLQWDYLYSLYVEQDYLCGTRLFMLDKIIYVGQDYLCGKILFMWDKTSYVGQDKCYLTVF